MSVEPAPSRPITNRPCSRYSRSVLVRLAARATGRWARVPAEVFQAPAVTPAERREGTRIPWAPKAVAERAMAPRLRGSVTLSSAMISGTSAASRARSTRSSGWAYSYGGSWSARPWWTAPSVSLSSLSRLTSSRAMPRLAAILIASRIRSSLSTRCATYRTLAGTSARRASTTGLRPPMTSGASSRLPPRLGRAGCFSGVRGPAPGALWALRFLSLNQWRSWAGGVAPLP